MQRVPTDHSGVELSASIPMLLSATPLTLEACPPGSEA